MLLPLEPDKANLVIVQASPFCNINCRYCYLPDRRSTKKISFETVEKIFTRLFEEDLVADGAGIVWHAGEPLALPIEFYEKAIDIINTCNTHNVAISHCIQSNATLLSPEWCELIKRRNIHIGISVDGPRHIHNRSRVDRAGKGTFEKVMRGIHLLQKHEINFYIIMVLTDYSLDFPDEIFQFLLDENILNWAFNIEETGGVNLLSTTSNESSIKKYRLFIERLLKINETAPKSISIRELKDLFETLLYVSDQVRSIENTPFKILSFDYSGNISTFSPELLGMAHERFESFSFGNVHDKNIRDIVFDINFEAIYKEIQSGVELCKNTCKYFSICGGGAPASKLYENGTFNSTETSYCRARIKESVDVVLGYLEEKIQ